MSIYMMAFVGTSPFGSLLAGALATKFGAPDTITIGGTACVIGAFIFLIKLPLIRKLIKPVYLRMGILTDTVIEKVK